MTSATRPTEALNVCSGFWSTSTSRPALVTYLKTEIAGQLRGMSQEAIFNAWVESQVSSMMDWLRERCLAEAELKGELWREAQ
jgi:hypothetical protein